MAHSTEFKEQISKSLSSKNDDEATSSRSFSDAQFVKCKANFLGVKLLIRIQVQREK